MVEIISFTFCAIQDSLDIATTITVQTLKRSIYSNRAVTYTNRIVKPESIFLVTCLKILPKYLTWYTFCV